MCVLCSRKIFFGHILVRRALFGNRPDQELLGTSCAREIVLRWIKIQQHTSLAGRPSADKSKCRGWKARECHLFVIYQRPRAESLMRRRAAPQAPRLLKKIIR